MALQTINLGGKDRPIRYSRRSMIQLQLFFGVKSFAKLGEAIQESGFEEIPQITFCGLIEGARKMGEPFAHTIEEVTEWIDDEPASIFQEILKAFGSDFSGIVDDDAAEKKETPKSKQK